MSDYQGLNFDVFPTFLQYATVQPDTELDSVSLKDLFESGQAPTSERELFFVRREGGGKYAGHAYHALIRGKWKLMQNAPFSPLELFDLQANPQETQNVIGQHPRIANPMRKALAAHIQAGDSSAWRSPGQ